MALMNEWKWKTKLNFKLLMFPLVLMNEWMKMNEQMKSQTIGSSFWHWWTKIERPNEMSNSWLFLLALMNEWKWITKWIVKILTFPFGFYEYIWSLVNSETNMVKMIKLLTFCPYCNDMLCHYFMKGQCQNEG